MESLIHWQDFSYRDMGFCCLAPSAARAAGVGEVCGRFLDCRSALPGASMDPQRPFFAEASVLDLDTGEHVPLDVSWFATESEARAFLEQWALALTGDGYPPVHVHGRLPTDTGAFPLPYVC